MVIKISEILLLPRRKLIVSSQEINLTSVAGSMRENTIFVLMVKESSGSAGGRGGGSGMRKIDRILAFKIIGNTDEQIYETNDSQEIEEFDIPYSAVAMDIVLESGVSSVVQGVIDPNMVKGYLELIKKVN
ncbi:MAG: hypothetical protein L0H53_02245 [Candidatus Nitrosocosmicus sp.]|nr:hypothetical protein [Candidatus Nitrosocosmicus sp.]MDN5865796.1 hypothetical protein [Candidatus Nitrosocosmicus sp.]